MKTFFKLTLVVVVVVVNKPRWNLPMLLFPEIIYSLYKYVLSKALRDSVMTKTTMASALKSFA